eukprot:Hpha_TRINITY_DN34683_c0_g1::TRINITY_DN34683_c0_g1_i1::g.21047::m.21047/K03106/SRP54, ffh; signal recognition particle subunit SRP54
MVLAELGGKINAALTGMARNTVITDEVIDQMLNDIARALIMSDVNVKVVKDLKERIKTAIQLEENIGFSKRKLIEKSVFQELRKMLDPGVKPYKPEKGRQNVVMFVGLQGSGKTTTCTKYALYWQKRGWKVGLICADTFRAGAYDQLRQNAAKAKVNFFGSLTETDPVVAAKEGVEKFRKDKMDIIIVDTSGRHKQEAALFDEMVQIHGVVEPDEVIFTMDGSIGQAAHEQATAFKEKTPVGSVIITKLDGNAKGGGALSAVAATESPICFIGTGEHFEDFEPFDANSFLSRLLGMGDVGGLMDKMKGAGIDPKSELYQRFTEGVFTMRDMYEHLQNLMKMGPMGKIMEMLPGAGNQLWQGEQSANRLKMYMCIMDSMNDRELDADNIKKMMTPDRQRRLARGAGRTMYDISEFLSAYHRFEDMAHQLGKMDTRKLDNPQALQGKQGAQQVAQLARAMDPQVLRQLGGTQGLQQMMVQLAETEQKEKVEKRMERAAASAGGGGG